MVDADFVRIKAAGMLLIIYSNNIVIHDDVLARQANHAFNKLLIGAASQSYTLLIKDYYVAPFWNIGVVGNSRPRPRPFINNQTVLVLQSGFHALAVNLV